MIPAVKILYLHGFRSSPLSMKGRLLGERMAQLGRTADYVAPQLPPSPQLAMEQAMALVQGVPASELAIIGSSLGGYYATWMAEQLGCRAALLNPAVTPLTSLERYVGMTTMFHSGEPFEFKREYIAELGELAVPAITRPERYYLMAATGDEVLDWRDMVAHYPGARHHVIDGSDHGIAEFAHYVDEVLAFCGIGAG
ncbi:YqiA/YcfP family alpha/beta fold hydrolase [Pseudoduganella lutea]|uniref:Esterase n=1 Tax=Pseudoduganella lutea TaxID=321985 RepID=A0A4P6KZB7_9BURK|nr:YqiA/YcfP family alpha/beta fold hydrolase [Pseudoduganella lutea]QBE64466.1 esterase [Pseudoduganella lutea]